MTFPDHSKNWDQPQTLPALLLQLFLSHKETDNTMVPIAFNYKAFDDTSFYYSILDKDLNALVNSRLGTKLLIVSDVNKSLYSVFSLVVEASLAL